MRSLEKLFNLLEPSSSAPSPHCSLLINHSSLNTYEKQDLDFLISYFSRNFDKSALPDPARSLFELSFTAFDNVLHGWMSELPIEAELVSFARKVLAGAKAANDRGDLDTLAVLKAAYKVQHEIHRMMGLLRFNPDEEGCYTARCEPDHLILPALGEYFTLRFGDTAWLIIDEKRGLCLSRRQGERFKLLKTEETSAPAAENDEWEDLWKHYHQTINNEERNNPGLQRQLMPKRYWKHLPEIKEK